MSKTFTNVSKVLHPNSIDNLNDIEPSLNNKSTGTNLESWFPKNIILRNGILSEKTYFKNITLGAVDDSKSNDLYLFCGTRPFRLDVSAETLKADEKYNIPAWTKNKPNQELVLGKNEFLFLKAGVPHECLSTLEDSLHFSFGLYND